MGEFYKIAERILNTINGDRDIIYSDEMGDQIKRQGITIDEIRDRVSSHISKEINFYPGIPGAPCHDLAVFVSLSSPLYITGRKHLKCGQAMEKIVQHMQGGCLRRTNQVVFVTDSWDEVAFAKWQANLEQISCISHFEIYLIAGRTISSIKI